VPGVLTYSPAEIVQQLLIDLGLGTTPASGGDQPAWPVIADNEPGSPNNCITVRDTAGVAFRKHVFGQRNRHHGFQIMVRGGTHRIGWPKANAIAEAIDGIVDVTIVTVGGTAYCIGMIRTTGDVLRLGPEANSTRRRFSVNGLIYVRQSE